MNKKVRFDINQFLNAISFAIDFVEMDILGASANHSKRVAYISLRIAEELGLSKAERSDIVAYSIMHDNGLCEETLHTDIQFQKMKQLSRMEGLKEHCEFGERNIVNYPLQSENTNIIKYHHENWDGSGFFHLEKDEIPLLAQIIGMADFTDNLFHYENGETAKIRSYIEKYKGIKFSPQVVNAFLAVSKHPMFWLDLKNEYLPFALKRHYVQNFQELSWEEIFDLTKVFIKIIDSKSRFTGRHSTGIVEKIETACIFFNITDEEKTKMKIAASLHDLGKLATSPKILEKPGTLDKKEMQTMKSHTYFTKLALAQIDHFEEIKEWAANHHEKLNGKGYPEGLTAKQLTFNCRLMACIDIYQALTEDRPYRQGLSFDETYSIMQVMVENGSIDKYIVDEFIPELECSNNN